MVATSTKVVVITGAGSGLGREIARRLLGAGHRVALAGRRRDALEATAGDSDRALVAPTDVTSRAEVAALFDRVIERWGRVDVLVNNAGTFGASGSVDELDIDEWQQVLDVNVTGAFLCAAEAVRHMKAQYPPGGRILNNGSVSAQMPRPLSAAYTMSKHAITGLTRSIALDGRPFDICCGQIDIGNAATDMTASVGVQALQPDGTSRAEPTFDPAYVAEMVRLLVELPLDVNVPFLTMMANGMPFIGRG